MAISEFEIKRYERELKKLLSIKTPPVHVRDQVKLGYRIENQSVDLREIRRECRYPSTKPKISKAKATVVKKEKLWNIYWQCQDLNWHRYEPPPRA